MHLTVLVVDRVPPVSLTQGNQLIARHLFPRLAEDHRLVLVAAAPPGSAAAEAVEEAYPGTFSAVHLVDRPRPLATLGGWVEGAAAARLPPEAPGLRDARALRDTIARIAAEVRPDVLHLRGLPLASHAVAAAPRLLELVDSETLGSERTAAAAQRHAPAATAARATLRAWAARRVEARALAHVDAVTTVADADAAAARALAPAVPVLAVPNGVDADHFAPLAAPEEPATIVFVGAFSFAPNIVAAKVLVHEVLPALRHWVPEVRVRLVGRDPAPEVRALAATPGVEVTGLVPDVRPHLAAATLVMCPMVSGSGIKNKVLEALAMARPVVATPLAVEGLSVVAGRDVAVAERSRLAAVAAALLRDPAARASLGASGRRLVETRYGWDAVARTYAALYDRLALAPRTAAARSA